MQTMHELDTALLQAMEAIEVLLAFPNCDIAELSRLRYLASRAVAARRQAVDLLINAAMSAGGGKADGARALRGGSLDMRMFYTNHVRAWPPARAVAEWSAYVAASHTLAETIRKQIRIERDLLYPDVQPVA